MAGWRSDLGEFRLTAENSYMGGVTGNTTMYLALQEKPGAESFKTNPLPVAENKQNIWDKGAPPKKGKREGMWKLVLRCAGSCDNGTTALSDDNLHTLLGAALGGSGKSEGSEVSGAGSTTQFTVQDVSHFAAGKFLLVEDQPRLVVSTSGDDVIVWPPLSGAPASSADVYPAFNYYPDDSAARTTFRGEYHRESNKLGIRSKGVSLIPQFSQLGVDEGMALVAFDAQSGDYEDIASDFSSARVPDTGMNPGPIMESGYMYLSDGSNNLALIPSSFTPTLPMKESRFKDGTAENGLGAPTLVPGEGGIEAVVYQPSDADDPIDQLRSWFTNRTNLKLFYAVGKTQGDCLAFMFPYVWLKEEPDPNEEVDGLGAVKLSLEIGRDRTSGATLNKAFYIGRM